MLEVPGKVFSREDIGKIINISKERTIDETITRLVQKIEANPKIQNIYKQLEDQVMHYGLNNLFKKILPKKVVL